VINMTRLQQFEAMLADEPNDPELRYALAMEHVSMGDDAGAVRRFEEMFERTPDYPHAYHQAGRTLERLGRLPEARAVLTRGIAVAQKVGDPHAAGEMQELLQMLD
jgi:Flp pilus assembly protein TadD